jgi:hypothetical protein
MEIKRYGLRENVAETHVCLRHRFGKPIGLIVTEVRAALTWINAPQTALSKVGRNFHRD